MIELLASIFTLICVYLTNKRSILSWPVGILGIIFYSIVFFQTKLYADFILQIVFIIQSIFGWINWNKNKVNNIIKVSKLTFTEIVYICIFYTFLSVLTTYLLFNFTNASLPIWDSQLMTLSLIANYLLIKRKLENWILWILVDINYVFMFIYKDLYFSSVLYFILLLIAISGFINWKKNYE